MGVFTTRRTFSADPSLIPAIARDVTAQFQNEGYTAQNTDLLGDNADISVTKGGIFKSVIGMKTALKITLRRQNDLIQAEAGVGIFGQQAIPTIISMLFFWPVLVTQVWGMIQQSHIDDHAMDLIEKAIQRLAGKLSGGAPQTSSQADPGGFCSDCGSKTGGGRFCTGCGTKLD